MYVAGNFGASTPYWSVVVAFGFKQQQYSLNNVTVIRLTLFAELFRYTMIYAAVTGSDPIRFILELGSSSKGVVWNSILLAYFDT